MPIKEKMGVPKVSGANQFNQLHLRAKKMTNMKRILTSALLLLSIVMQAQVKRITCIGASITEGARIENPKENSFPGQLQALLGKSYLVSNYGVSSTTMLKHGNYPYCNTDAYKAALKSNPDIVFIDLGGNDAKAINRPFYNEMEQDTRDMIKSFTSLPTHPRVIVLLPFKSFETDTMQIWDKTIVEEVTPRIQKAAYEEGVELLDIYSLLTDKPELFPDKIHPNKDGAGIVAKRLFQQITQNMDTQFDLFKNFKQSFTTTDFKGYACAEFKIDGHDCKVVKPKRVAKNAPWIWRARFWAHEPQTDIALLERGFHLIYCDVAELMGNKVAIETWNKLYAILHNAGLGQKGVLEGMSRGGVYALNWAAVNPDKVSAVYVDNPLLDCKVLARNMENDLSQMTKDFMAAYNLKNKADIQNFKGSPIDKTKAIAKGHYPILILCAENDEYVPPGEQAIPFENKIKAEGGEIKVIIKKGFKHHPHSFPNPTQIVDFLLPAVDKDFYIAEKKYDSYKTLVMAGYQGWFSAPGDGADRGWYHYLGRDGFHPGSTKVDMWPDVSEYDKIYKTDFKFANDSPAYVFSSYDESSVNTHFRWMREYGIDGVFVQRFVAEIKREKSYNQLNKVFNSAIHAANINNRAISIMYDLSGMEPGDEQLVLKDIDYISSTYDIKERETNTSYLFHNGKPLVAVWGVGFNDKRKYGLKESEIIIDALIQKGFSVLIGVPTHWRKLEMDCINDTTLHRLIRKCDVVMPWFVGRFNENNFAPYAQLVKEDIVWCKENKVDYAPLAFPGFSWLNMAKNSKPIPRNRGSFYWKQFSSYIGSGAEMLYLAMFDEIDEGTAIFKCATEVPVGPSPFVAIDKDLGSDYYLWLAGQATKMLRKEIPFTEKIPVRIRN